MNLRYFSLSEFDSPDLPDSSKNMDSQFLSMLDNARSIAGISFKITSGYRTESHNAKVGGVPKSANSKGSSHMYGYAADISAATGGERWIIVRSLIEAGFKRIGIAKSFIHTDNDPDKPNAIWTY
tara:strand:- start:6902 stop:7276 length:375 start_codon:yes stop_codon:yes gene_type:complete